MSSATKSDVGQAGEHLVAADLLTRGLKVTKLLNANSPHDLHVEVAEGWVTVQVKVSKVYIKTGAIHTHARKSILSDVIAAVDLVGKRVRYIGNPVLPPELADG